MPLNRIAIFSGLSAKQKKSRSHFTHCARTCRKEAPGSKEHPACLRDCLTTTPKRQKRRKK